MAFLAVGEVGPGGGVGTGEELVGGSAETECGVVGQQFTQGVPPLVRWRKWS